VLAVVLLGIPGAERRDRIVFSAAIDLRHPILKLINKDANQWSSNATIFGLCDVADVANFNILFLAFCFQTSQYDFVRGCNAFSVKLQTSKYDFCLDDEC